MTQKRKDWQSTGNSKSTENMFLAEKEGKLEEPSGSARVP